MNADDLASLLAELEPLPEQSADRRDQLRRYANWCTDRVLELAGPNGSEPEKQRLTALLTRTHNLLKRPK